MSRGLSMDGHISGLYAIERRVVDISWSRLRDLSISPIERERHFSTLLRQNMSNTLWVKHND